MGVAKYLLTSALPDRLKEALPTAHDLVNEFPLFSLLKLRVEIEQALSERARNLGCTTSWREFRVYWSG
jgi:hypothetical protein